MCVFIDNCVIYVMTLFVIQFGNTAYLLAKEHGHVVCADWLRSKLTSELANEMDDIAGWNKKFPLSKSLLEYYLTVCLAKPIEISDNEYADICNHSSDIYDAYSSIIRPHQIIISINVIGASDTVTVDLKLVNSNMVAVGRVRKYLERIRGFANIQIAVGAASYIFDLGVRFDKVLVPKWDNACANQYRINLNVLPISLAKTKPINFDDGTLRSPSDKTILLVSCENVKLQVTKLLYGYFTKTEK